MSMVSQDVLSEFFNHSIVLLCIADSKGRFLELNLEWERCFGYSNKELLGKRYFDLIHPNDIEESKKAFNLLDKKIAVVNDVVSRFKHKNGKYRWIECRFYHKDDKMYISAYDITKHKENKESQVNIRENFLAVKQELQLSKATIETASEAIYWLNINGDIIYTNALAVRMLGFTKEEFSVMRIYEIDPIYSEEKWITNWELQRSGKILENSVIESFHKKKNGTYINVEIQTSFQIIDDKEYQIAHVREISERIRYKNYIARSEEKYRVLFENMTSSFEVYEMILNDSGEVIDYRYEEVNHVSCQYTGYSPENIIGRTVKELFPQTEGYWIRTFGKVAETGEPAYFINFSVELDKYFEVYAFRPEKNHCAALFNDVSDRVRNELVLNKFKASIDNSYDGIFWINKYGGFDYVNKRACEMLKYPQKELIKLKLADIDPDWTYEEFSERWEKYISKDTFNLNRWDRKHKRKDGTFISVDVSAVFSWVDEQPLLIAYSKDISDRIKYEQALLKNQKLLKEAQRVANIGTWEDMISSHTYSLQEETYAIFGYTPDEIEINYETFFNLIYPDDLQTVLDARAEMKQTKRFVDHGYRIVRKDGQIRNVFVTGNLILDENQEAVRGYGIMQDVTESVKVKEAFVESEKNSRLFVEKVPLPVVILDNKLCCIIASERWFTDFNIKDKNIKGKSYYEVFSNVSPKWKKIHKHILNGETYKEKKEKYITSDGRELWLRYDLRPWYTGDKKIGGVVLFSEDITENVETSSALKETELKMESIFRVAPVGIGVIVDRKIVEMNPKGLEITGYSKEELIGMNIKMFYASEEEYQRIGELLKKEIPRKGYGQVETYWKIKDEEKKYVQINLTPLDKYDYSKGVSIVILDVTERKQYENALEKRVLALTRPLGDVGGVGFEDLFNIVELQKIQDSFAKATGVASIITYPDGKPITKPSNFCQLCRLIRSTEKGKVNCQASDALIGKQNADGPIINECYSGGLWDAGASITLGGVHIANWLIGQVRDKIPCDDQIVKYAEEIGGDKEEFRKALREVKIMSKEEFKNVADALYLLANEMSDKSYQNVQQARFISEQQRSEAALLKNQKLLIESQRMAKMGSWELELSDRVLTWNKEAYLIYGFDYESITPSLELFVDLVHEDDRSFVETKMEETLSTGIFKDFECRIITSHKALKYVVVAGAIIYDKENVPLRLNGIVQDVTEQKEAELEILKAKEQAEESEYFLKESQRIGNIGSFKFSFKNKQWAITETLSKLFGISYFKGGIDDWVALTHPDDTKVAFNCFYNELSNENNEFNLEYRIIRPNDKEIRWIHSVGRVYCDVDGNFIDMLGTVQDITDRKLIEAERKRMHIELEKRVEKRTSDLKKANEDLESFAYSVSHDLRAPIRHINGFVHLLKRTVDPENSKANEYFEKIDYSSKRMSLMIDELLKFSRLGRAKLNIFSIDLESLVREVIDQLKIDCVNRTVKWNILKLPEIKGDFVLMKIVVENLISNALKYTSKKDVAEIEIGGEKQNNKVTFYIKDNGVGFDMAYQDKLFGVFQRLHSNDDFEGIGIGLANVKQIINKHYGTIKVESEVDKGTIFYITLLDN